MSIDIETVKLLINVATFSMTKKIEAMETKFQTKVDTLEEENRQLYKLVEKLSETNAQNEMDKEDKNSFINKLYRGVKSNKTNITKLFEKDKINDENITNLFEITNDYDDYDENIDKLYNDCKNHSELVEEKIINLHQMLSAKCENDKLIIANIYTEIKNNDEYTDVVEENLTTLFKNCDIYNENFETNDENIEKLFNLYNENKREIDMISDIFRKN